MARKHIRHIRHHARKYEQAHLRLKELLRRKLYKEKIWDAFVWTFALTVITIVLFMNWGRLISVYNNLWVETPVPKPDLTAIHGFQSGMLATYQINGQTADWYIRYIRQIPGGGYEKGLETVKEVGKVREKEAEVREDSLLSSIVLTTDMSKGYHLTLAR